RGAARGLGPDRAVRGEPAADADCRWDLLRTRRPKSHPARQRWPNAQEDWNRRPPRHREDGRDQSLSRTLRQDQGRMARFANLCGRTGLAASTTADRRPAGSGTVMWVPVGCRKARASYQGIASAMPKVLAF